MLRRLKNLGAKEEELLDVYTKQIRSVLEMAVPVWEPGLTKKEKKTAGEGSEICIQHYFGP